MGWRAIAGAMLSCSLPVPGLLAPMRSGGLPVMTRLIYKPVSGGEGDHRVSPSLGLRLGVPSPIPFNRQTVNALLYRLAKGVIVTIWICHQKCTAATGLAVGDNPRAQRPTNIGQGDVHPSGLRPECRRRAQDTGHHVRRSHSAHQQFPYKKKETETTRPPH